MRAHVGDDAGDHASILTNTPSRGTSGRRPMFRLGTPTLAALATVAVLLPAYLATAAPDLTFWDASEFMTAAHTLGVPHPPGTPLWVLLGRLSAMLFASNGPARAVTMLSVIATVLAGALAAALWSRWLGGRAAVAAAVSGGAMCSVWANATETEVYAVALLLSVAMLVAGDRAGRDDTDAALRRRARGLLVFLAALAVPMHLSSLVALPAAIALAWKGDRPDVRELRSWLVFAALGLSPALVLPLRALHAPLLNEGNPSTFRSLFAVLTRAQYDVPGLLPRRAPLWLQLGNVFEWADWQVALGLRPSVEPSWTRTPLSILWAWFGVMGLRSLWQRDRRAARAMLVLLASGTLGVALWLNLRLGPSFGVGLLPTTAMHEARERDYFFVLGFWAWGLLAGAGIAALAQVLTQRMAGVLANGVQAALLALAALPLVANASVMDRTREPEASLPRVFARLLLDAVPQGGVLFVAGDNDTFPLWYLQRVEQYREDVVIVTMPLLGTAWHRAELARRTRLVPDSMSTSWHGLEQTLAAITEQATRQHRAFRVSVFLSAADRRRIAPSSAWALEGLVYAPLRDGTAGAVLLDLAALVRAQREVPQSALTPLRNGIDNTAETMQGLLRCTTIRRLTDPLLASTCNGI